MSYGVLQRELARQTTDIMKHYSQAMEHDGFPALRTAMCIGGTSVKEQMDVIRQYVLCLT